MRPFDPSNRCGGAAALIACLGLAACASAPPDSATHEPTTVERKQTMLLATERAIHIIFEDARTDLVRIQKQFEAEVVKAPACYSLASAEPGLEPFGVDRRKERATRVAAAASRREQQLKLLLGHYETALWAVACEAGRREAGDGLGTRTGYVELDQKVDAALLQLAREVDTDGAIQAAEAASSDHVALERQIRHEIRGVGVLSLYKSQPIRGTFGPDDEGQATVAVFARAKPDPYDSKAAANGGTDAPPPGKVSFVQAVRRHVERGGLMVAQTEWKFDAAATDASGTLSRNAEVDVATYLASEICLPMVDKSDPSFRQLWDHVLVAEYRTALRNDDNGELIAVVGWQVRWNIDWMGRMRVLVDPFDQVLADDPVLPRLLALERTGG